MTTARVITLKQDVTPAKRPYVKVDSYTTPSKACKQVRKRQMMCIFDGSDFFHLFGNSTHTGSIGKNCIVFIPIGKTSAFKLI